MLKFLAHLNQMGGAKSAKSSGSFPWIAFLVSILLLVIRALLVQWSYNYIMPRVFVSMGGNPNAFQRLSLADSVVLVILAGSLF